MDNNYDALPDGSLLYQKPITVASNYYMVDPTDPCHYIPKVPPCTARRINLRTLNCGRHRSTWFCDLLKRNVSVKECNECQTPA